MGFSLENGYVPATIESIMQDFMAFINIEFGLSYTWEQFQGTNFYKYYYAAAQKHQENEIKTGDIFLKLQQYILLTNQRISRPVVTNPGLVDKMTAEGYVASVKPMIDADAGKIHVCVDVDDTDPDYAAIKLDICKIIKDSTVAGAVTQGTEVESIVLSNGQSFDFKYNLPNLIPVALRLTITLSENNQSLIATPDEVKQTLLANINAKYRLGKNFEPQKYFSIVNAPWASQVLLEWTDDVTGDDVDPGAVWNSTIYNANYDDLFGISLARIELIEA